MVVMTVVKPSPSFAVIVVKVLEPVNMVLIGTKIVGLEEGRMTVDFSRVGIGEEARGVKNGIGVIGKSMHAVRSERRRKKQDANSNETTAAN